MLALTETANQDFLFNVVSYNQGPLQTNINNTLQMLKSLGASHQMRPSKVWLGQTSHVGRLIAGLHLLLGFQFTLRGCVRCVGLNLKVPGVTPMKTDCDHVLCFRVPL